MASYKGVTIKPGSDSDVAAQVAAIDGRGPTANTPITPPAPVNKMNAADLGKSQGTYSSWFPTPTASTGLATSAVSARDGILSGLARETDSLATDQATGRSAIVDLMKNIGGLGRKRNSMYEDEGVNDLRREIDEITNGMEARDRSYTNQIREAEKNTEGKLVSGVNIDVNNLSKSKAAELADMAIVLSAKTRNFNTAKAIIDEKVTAETEELKIQLEGLKFFYAENASTLTENKRTLLEQKIDQADTELEEARELRTKIGEFQFQAAANGAGTAIVAAVGAATTVDGAIAAMGTYASDPLDRKAKEASIAASYASAAASGRSNRGGSGGGGVDAYTDTESRAVYRAGIGGAPERVKEIFLNAPAGFRQDYSRNGFGNAGVTPDILNRNIAEWKAVNANSSANDDAVILQGVIEAARNGG